MNQSHLVSGTLGTACGFIIFGVGWPSSGAGGGTQDSHHCCPESVLVSSVRLGTWSSPEVKVGSEHS